MTAVRDLPEELPHDAATAALTEKRLRRMRVFGGPAPTIDRVHAARRARGWPAAAPEHRRCCASATGSCRGRTAGTATSSPSGCCPDRPLVLFTRPEHAREIFAADPETFLAGRANSILGPMMGEHSLLLQDGAEHQRARKLLMPAFNGHALREYGAAGHRRGPRRRGHLARRRGAACAGPDEPADARGDPARGLRGHRRAPDRPCCARASTGSSTSAPRCSFGWSVPRLRRLGPWRAAQRNAEELDQLIHAEIRERRAAVDLADRTDVLSRLLRAGAGDGDALTDEELRDQLVTLSWPGTRPPRPRWRGRSTSWAATRRCWPARSPLPTTGDDAWLEAVLKESMRLHPVIPMVARTLDRPRHHRRHRPARGRHRRALDPAVARRARRTSRSRGAFRPERFVDGSPRAEHLDPLRWRGAPLHRRGLLADGGRGHPAGGADGVHAPDARAGPAPRSATSPACRAAARGSASPHADPPPPPRKPPPRPARCRVRRSPLVSTAASLRERLRRLRMDVTPLRESRDFRLTFTAGTVFDLAGMVSYVAIPFQVFDLTGSNFLGRRDRPGRAPPADRLRPVRRRAGRPRRPAPPAHRQRPRAAGADGGAGGQLLPAPSRASRCSSGSLPPRGHVVPPASVARGPRAAHRAARPDHRRQRPVELRHAGGVRVGPAKVGC